MSSDYYQPYKGFWRPPSHGEYFATDHRYILSISPSEPTADPTMRKQDNNTRKQWANNAREADRTAIATVAENMGVRGSIHAEARLNPFALVLCKQNMQQDSGYLMGNFKMIEEDDTVLE